MLLRELGYIPSTYLWQHAGRGALRRRQLRELDRMLAFSRARVPHYRQDARYDLAPLGSVDDLAKLPLLTKEQVRARPEAFLADGLEDREGLEFFTSGTTGQRLRVLHDRRTFDYQSAACLRRFTATGRYLPTDRLSHLRHFVPPKRSFERLGLFRRQVILTHLPMPQIKAALLANRPRVIIGYPVHLRALLRELTGDELARLRRTLRMLMTESELLVPEHRRLLTEGFGVPVFDEYSTWEVLTLYYECSRGGRHLAEDRVHVEVVDDAGEPVPDGTQGWVVATSFMERAMPLVRYALGDAGLIERERCPCGRRLRTLRLTRGRVNDVVVLPDGRRLYSDTFLELAERHPGVAECFVRQDRHGLVRVHVVAERLAREGERAAERLRERLFEVAGGPFALEVVPAAGVPITAGGKGKFVASEFRPEG